MTDTFETRLQEVFARAVELPAAERALYLDRACAGDATFRTHVESLLAAHSLAGRFLATPAVAPTAARGEKIGRYTLLEVVGEGGFATVHRAEQLEPIRREVALKIIKLGMDTKQVIARFEAERQALAILDHPNIAKVFDAGTTDTGRPYFAMELVRGMPITKYCDAHHLTPRQRLALFIPICQAVQHAHQKGIIHRDIKPNNVLVANADDRPVSKVIDFGIAKAVDSRLTERTLFTELGQFIGTPAYMSPEQAGFGNLDIDTRSDIYSLGVLLYELLTGTTPIEEHALRASAYDEVQRMIREFEPPSPSTRITSIGERASSIAAVRNVEPKTLRRTIRGEVDWIVMRCLEKDRNRRYASASALSDDIARHLNGDDVLARAPTRAYRVRKFARRHAAVLSLGSVLFVVLVAALIMTSVALVRERRAAALAERANLDARGAVWASVGWDGPDRPTKLFQENYDRLRAAYGDDHKLTISAKHGLARLATQEGNYAKAQEILVDNIERSRRVCGKHSVELLIAATSMVHCLNHQRRFEETIPYAREVFDIVDSDEMPAAHARYYAPQWGYQLTKLQRYAEAREPLLGALRIIRARSPDAHELLKEVLLCLAEGADTTDEPKLAEHWRREAYVEARAAAALANGPQRKASPAASRPAP